MQLQKILSHLMGRDQLRHRLVVDAQIAEPIEVNGLSLTCKMKHIPISPAALDIYLGYTENDDPDLKIGQYHFSAEIVEATNLEPENTRGMKQVSLRILPPVGESLRRRSDRWSINHYPIKFRRLNQATEYQGQIIDLSAEGIGIAQNLDLKVGEILELHGLAAALEMDIKEPVRFEVRTLPTASKAGLMLIEQSGEDIKLRLVDFSIQMRQANRFWTNFMDSIRVKLGHPVHNSTLPSVDFTARQLLRKPATLKMLVDVRKFKELTESLALLDRYSQLVESLAELEAEKNKLEPLSTGKRQLLANFLDKAV